MLTIFFLLAWPIKHFHMLGQCFAYSSLAVMRHHNKANYKVRHLTGSLLIVSADYSYHHGSEQGL